MSDPRSSMRHVFQRILRDYELRPDGIHGVEHWGRVLENGRRLCTINGANSRVVELFALLHDSRREDDGWDPDHGPRAAAYAESLHGECFRLEKRELRQLLTACETHTFGKEHRDLTVKTCWDSDRLDLGRLHIVPDPKRLATEAARDSDVIDWAFERGSNHLTPTVLEYEWGYDERAEGGGEN